MIMVKKSRCPPPVHRKLPKPMLKMQADEIRAEIAENERLLRAKENEYTSARSSGSTREIATKMASIGSTREIAAKMASITRDINYLNKTIARLKKALDKKICRIAE